MCLDLGIMLNIYKLVEKFMNSKQQCYGYRYNDLLFKMYFGKKFRKNGVLQ